MTLPSLDTLIGADICDGWNCQTATLRAELFETSNTTLSALISPHTIPISPRNPTYPHKYSYYSAALFESEVNFFWHFAE